jgi:GR25 family glycosyltransferase involved in LPS biosynthesis
MNQFDQLYYINLEYRKDMYDSINNVIDNLKFDRSKVTRINAIKKDNGAYGCALSHIQALEDAKKNGYNKVLIFEDDFQPFDYIDTNNKITKFLNEVQDWDLVQLSSNDDCDKKNIGIDNVYKVLNCQSTIAYAIQRHFIDKLLEVFIESANQLSKIENYIEPCPYCIDVNWKKIQKENNWYTFYPILGREYPKYSDVQHKYIDHFGNFEFKK